MIAISRHGQVIYANAWEWRISKINSKYTIYNSANCIAFQTIYSSSDSVVGQEGKLSLDDNIRKYLPALPQFENRF
jgi:hypothetical protein